MKKRLMAVFGTALILTVVSVTGVALAGNGPDAAPGEGLKTGGEPPTTQPPLRSDDGIDPDKCNRIHNINACFPDGKPNTGVATGEPYPAPGANGPKRPAQCGPGQITVPVTSDGQRYCVTPEDAPGGEPPTTQGPFRSDDGIDPDKCNIIHNVDACYPDGEPNTGVATGEPGIAIGEPYPAPGANGPKGPAQCGPGQITVPVTSDGQRYCVTLEDAPSVTDPGPVIRSHQR